MNALRRVVQRLLNPFPPFPLIAGQYSSPLEARACAAGHGHVERAFAEPQVRGIVTAFVRFLGDAEAERALKKAYHMAYEQRVRTLAFRLEPAAKHGFDPIPPPEGDHPLDRVARAELEALDARAAALPVSDRGRFAQLAAALAWGFSLVAAASYIALRHGRSRVPPHRVDVLVPEIGPRREPGRAGRSRERRRFRWPHGRAVHAWARPQRGVAVDRGCAIARAARAMAA